MKKLIALTFTTLALWGCTNSTNKPTSHSHPATHTEEQQANNSSAIALDNGAKWAVNLEMKPFVQKGAELVNSYIQEKKTNYQELAKQLADQNDRLVKSCTMDGKSHHELHKWLHPHLEMVKRLEQETNIGEANKIVLQLQNSYQQYHRYFD